MTEKTPAGIEAKGGRYWVTYKRKHVGTYRTLEAAQKAREAASAAAAEPDNEKET